MSDTIDSALVKAALEMAVQQRRPKPGLIFHSDRGVQYAADAYQDLLCSTKAVCSMSRKGDCLDNACAENFFSTLKGKHIQERVYATRKEVQQDVFWYSEDTNPWIHPFEKNWNAFVPQTGKVLNIKGQGLYLYSGEFNNKVVLWRVYL